MICFSKNSKCCNIYDSHKKKKKPNGTHNITLEIAEQLKCKGISVIPGWRLCRNCRQKTKDLPDDEIDINECDDGDVDEFETSLQILEQKDMLNESFGIIGISPVHSSNPPPLQSGGMTSSNLAIRVGMKYFF